MADKISGKIQYLNERDGQYGKSYNIKVDGTTYYLKGKFPPRGIDAGDFVEFEVEMKGNYPTVVTGTLRKTDTPASAKAQPPATKAAFTKTGGFDADRQDIISKQAALNTALEFLKFAHANETLPVPKQKNAGFGYLKTIWLQEAAALFELNTGKTWELPEQSVEEEAPKPVKKAAKKAAPPATLADDFEDDELPDFGGEAEDDAW